MLDKRMEREMVLKLWSEGKSEIRIGNVMKLDTKKVHNLIYGEPVSITAILDELGGGKE